MGFRLIVTKGKSEGKQFSFTKALVKVGRYHDNDLVLYDLNVSRNHFEIVQSGNAYLLRDCGSQNGTKLNHKSAVEQVLHTGDRIQLGDLELEFSRSDTQPRVPTSAASERAELFAPGSPKRRVKLEGVRTAASRKRPNEMKDGEMSVASPLPSSRHKKKAKPLPVEQTPPSAEAPEEALPKRWYRADIWRWVLYPTAAVAVAIVVVAVVVALYKPKPPDFSEQKFPIGAVLNPKSYGAGRVDTLTPKHAQFVWTSNGGRTILGFTPGGIDRQGEVSITLNGAPLADVAVTGPSWGNATEIKIDRKLLKKGDENLLVFVHHAGAGEAPRWGIRELSLLETPLPPPSLADAKKALKLADEALLNKRIALGNLALACDNYKKATLLLDGLDTPPSDLERAEGAWRSTDRELDRTVNDGLFRAEKAKKLGRIDESEAILRELLAYVPHGDDPRHKAIEERIRVK